MFDWIKEKWDNIFWDWHSPQNFGGTGYKSLNVKNLILFLLFFMYGFAIIYLYIK